MRLLLVDGHYYAYRSFFAIRHLANSAGEPTNAIFGMVKALKRMLADLKPDYAAVIFDEGPPQKRLDLQADYKSTRAETPAEFEAQMPFLFQAVDALGFPRISVFGEEADDLMAAYSAKARALGWECILATNDKDLMQLVHSSCKVYQPGKEDFSLLGEQEVTEKWGVPPERVGDLLALTGDSVDAIPGVGGIGPKTAAALLGQFGTLDELLNKLDEVKSQRQREALQDSLELISRNREMVRLRCDLPLPMDAADLKIQPNYAKQAELFARCEFRTFLREAREMLGQQETTPNRDAVQGELFG